MMYQVERLSNQVLGVKTSRKHIGVMIRVKSYINNAINRVTDAVTSRITGRMEYIVGVPAMVILFSVLIHMSLLCF